MRPARKFKRPASRFKKIATGLAIALTGLVAAALILPGYIDWNRFKGEIEQQASAITGRQLHIGGAIGFSLLPRPALSLENATLANSEGAQQSEMLSLERLEARLSVLPLFSGKIQVANFRLIAPVLNLETLPDGSHNWSWLTDGRTGVRFDHVLIERGQLRYFNHLSGDAITLGDIEMQLSAGSLNGPYKASGSLRLQDIPITLDAMIGLVAPSKAGPVSIKAVLDGNTSIDFTGSIDAQGKAAGVLNSQGTDLTGGMAAIARLGAPGLSAVQPALLRRSYRIETRITAGPGQVKAEKIKLSLGENILTGAVSIDTRAEPRFEAILATTSIDLDAFRATPPPGGTSPALSAGFSIPRDVNGTLRLTANAVKLNGGQMRDVRIGAALSDGIVIIDEFAANLPGSTSTLLSGAVTAVDGQPHFTGDLGVRSENLRGLLDWLAVQAPAIPARSLSRAELNAQLDVSPELVDLRDMSAQVDSSRLTGSLAIALRARPAFGVDLRIDQINADAYFPEAEIQPGDIPSADSMAPGGALDIARRLTGHYDSNFKLSIDALTWRGVPVSRLKADGALLDGTLAINSLAVADMAGTAFSLSGVLSNFATAAQGEVNVRLASNDLSGLARAMGLALPVPGAQLGKSAVEAKILLANAGLETVIESRFGETALQISGGVNGVAPGLIAAADAQTTFDLRLSLSNSSLRKFSSQAGLEIFPGPEDDSAGILLNAELISKPGEAAINALAGSIGRTQVRGQAVWQTGGPKPLLKAEFSAGEIIAGNFIQTAPVTGDGTSVLSRQLPWSGAPFDVSFLDWLNAEIKLTAERFSLRGFDIGKAALVFNISDGRGELKQFTGSLFGGEASASASLRGGDAPEFTASWKLQNADLEPASMALSGAPVITGRLDFSGQVRGQGASSFALASSLEGEARITAADGQIRDIDLPGFSARLQEMTSPADFPRLVDEVLQSGATRYQRILAPFTIRQGVAQSNNSVVSIDSVTGGLQASIDLPRYWLSAEASLTLNAHMNAPPMGIAYIGPLDNPERSLRTEKLENYFTQSLMSKSLQRVISNRDAHPAPAPTPAPAPSAPQAAPALPQPAAPAPEKPAKNVINSILDSIIRDK